MLKCFDIKDASSDRQGESCDEEQKRLKQVLFPRRQFEVHEQQGADKVPGMKKFLRHGSTSCEGEADGL